MKCHTPLAFALITLSCSVAVHAQSYQDTQRQYDEQRRERQERERDEQRRRNEQRDHDHNMSQMERERSRNAPQSAGAGGDSSNVVGAVVALGVAAAFVEAVSRASQHRSSMIGYAAIANRLCIEHPMLRQQTRVFYQWEGDPKVYAFVVNPTYFSGRTQHTVLEHPTALSVKVMLEPVVQSDPPRVFELASLKDATTDKCRSLPKYGWRFGAGAAVQSMWPRRY